MKYYKIIELKDGSIVKDYINKDKEDIKDEIDQKKKINNKIVLKSIASRRKSFFLSFNLIRNHSSNKKNIHLDFLIISHLIYLTVY